MAKPFRLASINTGRAFLGVLSGISNATGIDAGILRIAFVVSIFAFGIPVGLYFGAWFLGLLFAGYDD